MWHAKDGEFGAAVGETCLRITRSEQYWQVLCNAKTKPCLHGAAVKSSDEGGNSMSDFGKLLILLGGFLVLAGLLTLALGRTHFPLGRLPGDFVYRGKNTSFYFPLATSILLSFILSFVLYVINRWRR